MIVLRRDQQRRLAGAVRRAYPREACGLLFARAGDPVDLRLVPTAPTWNTPISFRIRRREIERFCSERVPLGEQLVGCFHSHLVAGPGPTGDDRRGAEQLGGLWLIYSVPAGRAAMFHWDGSTFQERGLQLL